MTKIANIKFTQLEGGKIQEEWVGSKLLPLLITDEFIRQAIYLPKYITEVSRDYMRRATYWVRTDTPLWILLPIAYKFYLNVWINIKPRILYYMNRVGLAHTEIGCVYQWRDIFKHG
jgi:lipopolysaccharide/colanic/teichoic acid biosynthesis glycosyltransferase